MKFFHISDLHLGKRVNEFSMIEDQNISQTNRLIGIISHVNGLDEKIDRKIVVTKNRNGGSEAQVQVG